MSRLRLSEKIKQLLGMKIELNKDTSVPVIQYEREYSEVNGFQLNFGDLDEWTLESLKAGNIPQEAITNMINYANNTGYIPPEVGEFLVACLKDTEQETYIKTIHSKDMKSIFEEGIRCLGNSTSGFGNVPRSIDEISLQHTIKSPNMITELLGSIKLAYTKSQGNNPIDGTLIIQIPKNIPKEEIYYFNENSNTFNIKPEFIKGFVSTNEQQIVSDMIYPTNEKTM